MKKLTVCGKGGSGKSTIVSLLAHGLTQRGYSVLVVDADESNLGLYRILGMNKPPATLMESVGGKKGIKERLPPKSAQGLERTETEILESGYRRSVDIPAPYIRRANGISLVSIGKIKHALEGCACPIGALGKEFLDRLEVGEEEMVLVDMEAGVEHFGRGVEAGVDCVLIVVDPSFESIELAARINTIASDMGIKRIKAIINKVSSEEMAGKLHDSLIAKDVMTAGIVYQDEEVFLAGLEGRTGAGNRAQNNVEGILDNLLVQES